MTIAGKIILKKGKEYSIERKHPWIFSGAIQRTEGVLTDGCWTEVADYKGNILGFGHYQNGSIAIRLLSFGKDFPANDFWSVKIASALSLRKAVNLPTPATNAFRLIHGEGDGLP
ncbi:MAG TPA: class I SAM-dependent rRNA methyltransferase, partial [Chryseolinea sp.]